MRYNRLDLLTLLVSLFIFSSCSKVDDSVGLDVDPQNQIDAKLVDTASIRTNTVKDDTVATNGLSQHPFGYLQDSELGTTEANIALTITSPTTDLSFGTSPVLDSAVLVLKYGNEFYGDSVSSQYRVDVRELNETFTNTTAYYNTKVWNVKPDVVGGKLFKKFTIHDSVRVNYIRDAKRDTMITRSPHIRIPINAAFINNKFFNAPAGTFATTTAFQAYMKGLYLSINKTQSTGKGGIGFFDLATADSSRLEIYYRNIAGTTIDTNFVNFGVTATNAAASIVHTYSTAVQTQLSNPAQQFPTVYVKPLAGLRTRVFFPYITKLKELGNITINKAELVIQVADTQLDPAQRLTLYRTDIASQRVDVPDNNLNDPRYLSEFSFGGGYDKTRKRYIINVTSYIQDLISGKLTQYGAYLAPLSIYNTRTNGDLAVPTTIAYRSVLGGGNSTSYKMKLNIIYTRVK
ncbi:DUF4270 domain-containing protein [Hufsiella ginkgonis]|uniref:DUF4270 family protein n=1 Tax=Hufsiella ginkgonis TaxID=2695274 RepID=A0A7K1XSW1_9SPHI|nr:DUF4270 domain-containing protein [Hufsiella ginkgonis]MXV13967.1 DUF4270 family protein [Hufsiella ginkgonis]